MSPTDVLGKPTTVTLSQGPIQYYDMGSGRPVVFVHGVFVNAALWRNVAPQVAAAGYRAIAVDWPLGGHTLPMNRDAKLDPISMAAMIDEFLAALDLEDAVLVATDTGGAFVQIAAVRHPERIGALVLASVDALERFFPPIFKFLTPVGKLPSGTWFLANTLRFRTLQRLPLAFGFVTRRTMPKVVTQHYTRGLIKDRRIRRDLGKVLGAVSNRHTLKAAEHFHKVTIPVLLAWGRQDKLFPYSLAERLLPMFPNARLVGIDDSSTFVSEDQPEELTKHLIAFVNEQRTSPVDA